MIRTTNISRLQNKFDTIMQIKNDDFNKIKKLIDLQVEASRFYYLSDDINKRDAYAISEQANYAWNSIRVSKLNRQEKEYLYNYLKNYNKY